MPKSFSSRKSSIVHISVLTESFCDVQADNNASKTKIEKIYVENFATMSSE